jgi:hypothetical protein
LLALPEMKENLMNLIDDLSDQSVANEPKN